MHVPLIARCPGTVPASASSDALIEHVDLGPTFLEALGVAPMKVPGRSAWNVCLGPELPHREWVYSAMGGAQVCRDHRWKRIHYVSEDGCFDGVFDLVRDPRERQNLAETGEASDIIQRLRAELQDKTVREFRRHITDLHPDARPPRLLPFWTT